MTTKYVPQLLLIPTLLALAGMPERRPLVIAVLDSGFGYMNFGHEAKLCKYGHKDFIGGALTRDYGTVAPVPVDTDGHGTNVVGLIEQSLHGKDYCIVVVKVFGARLGRTIDGIRYADNIHADFINLSGGGNQPYAEEAEAIANFVKHGGTIVAAAGNDGRNLDSAPYYPASYPGVIAVGNLTPEGVRASTSNYGTKVKLWEVGTDALAYHLRATGTSQATAVATGRIVAKRLSQGGQYAAIQNR